MVLFIKLEAPNASKRLYSAPEIGPLFQVPLLIQLITTHQECADSPRVPKLSMLPLDIPDRHHQSGPNINQLFFLHSHPQRPHVLPWIRYMKISNTSKNDLHKQFVFSAVRTRPHSEGWFTGVPSFGVASRLAGPPRYAGCLLGLIFGRGNLLPSFFPLRASNPSSSSESRKACYTRSTTASGHDNRPYKE